MPAAPPAAYPVPEATEAHLPAIVPEAPTRQGTVREREATTVLPAHPLPETPPEVPAGIQEVSLLPHPDRAPQEVREAQAQPEVQVPPIRPGATEATIPEATQGTPATRALPEIPATLPGVQEAQLQEARAARVHPGTQESLPGIPTVPPEALLQGVRAAAIREAPAAAIRAVEVPEVMEAVTPAVDTPEVRAEVPVAADAGSISMNTSNENSYESI